MTHKISPKVVCALDVARAASATYVVIHHVANHYGWSSHGIGLVFRFGQEAVLVFFLLSGFVIFSNERDRVSPPFHYFWRRIRRIYPTLLFAMLVSTIVAADNGTLTRDFHISELAGTLFALQDISSLKPGVIVDPFMGNDPLWSLSYELAFYFAFPFVVRAWRNYPRVVEHGIGIFSCATYVMYALAPNHWTLVSSYFLVWWCGAAIADRYQKGERSFRSLGAPLSWLGALCGTAAIVVFLVGPAGLGVYPILPLRHFAVALFLTILLFGAFGGRLAELVRPTAAVASSAASISYGLYVLHFPLLILWDRAQGIEGFLVGVLALLICAYVADLKMLQLISKSRSNKRTAVRPSPSG